MKIELHKQAYEERKDTLFKWCVEVKGIENSQRIIGDNASRAIVEMLSAYLLAEKKVEAGFQLNHAWFKSETVMNRLPEFSEKQKIVSQMIRLEKLCEQLSYGTPKPVDTTEEVLRLFLQLEKLLLELLRW